NGCGRGRCRSSSATAPSTSWTTPGRWRTRTSRAKLTRDQRRAGSRELFQAAQTLWTSAERTTPPALRHQRLPAGRTLDLRPLRKQVHRDRGAGKSVPPRSSCQLKRFAFCSTVVPPEGLDPPTRGLGKRWSRSPVNTQTQRRSLGRAPAPISETER